MTVTEFNRKIYLFWQSNSFLRWLNYNRLFSDSFIGDTEDGDEYDDPFAGPPDTISLASERYDKDDEGPSDGMWDFPIDCSCWHSNTKQCNM